MKPFILLFISVLLTASCSSTSVKKDTSFDQKSATGMIVFGLTLSPLAASPIVKFRKYDPGTGKASTKETFGTSFLSQAIEAQQTRDGVKTYFFLNMPAGHWYLESFFSSSNDGMKISQNNIIFSSGTFAFEAKPGVAAYVGEYHFAIDQFGHTSFTKQKDMQPIAESKLLGFPNIRAGLEKQMPLAVRFSCDKKLALLGPNECDAEKIIVQPAN